MSTTDREAGRERPRAGADPGVEVRPMTAADLTPVLAIERAAFAVPWTPSTFRSLLGRDAAAAWVAETAGEVVGYAVVWAVLDQAELGNVAVAAGHRRRGVGSLLVETALAWSAERGVREVFLEVRASNAGAQRLYEAHGFEVVGRRVGYYGRPREDALVLRRRVAAQ